MELLIEIPSYEWEFDDHSQIPNARLEKVRNFPFPFIFYLSFFLLSFFCSSLALIHRPKQSLSVKWHDEKRKKTRKIQFSRRSSTLPQRIPMTRAVCLSYQRRKKAAIVSSSSDDPLRPHTIDLWNTLYHVKTGRVSSALMQIATKHRRKLAGRFKIFCGW